MKLRFYYLLLLFPLVSTAQDYQSSWRNQLDMPWIGEELWANRLQDWEIKNGSLYCNITGKNRSVALLTHKIKGSFTSSVAVKFANLTPTPGIIGFEIGRQGPVDDFRSAAIYGKGITAGINKKGELVIGEKVSSILISPQQLNEIVKLELDVRADGKQVTLTAKSNANVIFGAFQADLPADKVMGYVALISDFDVDIQQQFVPSAVFTNWRISGSLDVKSENTYGPIFFAQYTVSNEEVKLSAQCAPIDLPNSKLVLFLQENGKWRRVAAENIDKMSRTAVFRLKNWKSTEAVPYRLEYELPEQKGEKKKFIYEGKIAPEPNATDEIKLGLFSSNLDYDFPDADLRKKIRYHNVNAALFLGNQLYEESGGFGVEASTLPRSVLDYLRKWYQFGWSYRDVFRDIPMITIPGDHDVYHGKIWGENGKEALLAGSDYERQDGGGYKMPVEWVKMVQRTQTAHLPDAIDPTPVLQNMPVYFTHLNWGPLSFAIIEDRKFKSAPKNILPTEAAIVNGFTTNPGFKSSAFDTLSNAELLGKRQEKFLENWTQDWKHGAKLKILLSQSNFCTLATLPKGSMSEANVPSLPVPPKGEYISGDVLVKDMDSNGWPHNKRNEAVKIIRKGFTLHLAGDQQLGSVVKYGVDEFDDGGFAFTGPSLNTNLSRRWWPQLPAGHEPIQGKAASTGKFEDGFLNKITVHAVGNPYKTNTEPAIINERIAGYGIVNINPTSRQITMEYWPRSADPATGLQVEGWPVTISQEDNYGREPFGYLPTIKITDYDNAVVQVINQGTGEILYTVRLEGNEFLPKVFEAGTYIVRYGEPDKNLWLELRNLTVPRFGRRIRTKLFIE